MSPSTSHDGTGDGGLEERKETKVEETEVHMRLVPLIRLSDQLISFMNILGVMPR